MSHKRYDVLAITEREQKSGPPKTFFSRVGVAFPLREGEGLTVTLDALPVSGKLLIKPPRENGGGDDIP